ncbi:MAG: ATP-binding protein [Myxococcota bacterium]
MDSPAAGDASAETAERRDFWRSFDVHRLQLRMQLLEALGTRRFGLAVITMIVPDPVSAAGAQFAQHQRDAWLDGDWHGLSERVQEHVAKLLRDGLGWPTWLELLRPVRGVLTERVLSAFATEPARARSALQGLAQALDHLTQIVGDAMDQEAVEHSGPLQIEPPERGTSEDAIRLAIDAAPIAIVAVAEDGSIVTGNRQAESMLGYARGELEGVCVDALLPEAQRSRHTKLRERYAAMPTARAMAVDKELVALRKDGSEIRVEVGLSPYIAGPGRLVLASMYEVTQDRQSAARLRRTLMELERSNEELEQFAYVVSHDLQEPLRMVSSYTELLRRQYHGKLDESADLYINYAVDGAQRLSRVVQELLMYSRVGSRAGSFVPTDTSQMVAAVLDDLELALEECGAQVVVEGHLPTIVADSSQLRLVFQNLIGNAIKFAREGVPSRVGITAERKGDQWHFAIEDNGLGIDAKYADRIFGLFQRLHSRDAYEGSGIGLTITRRVVERHGGRIWVDSTPGQGSIFRFALPLWPVTV